MKIFFKIAAIVLVAFFCCLQKAPAEEVQRKVLQNGLVILLKESHRAPLVAIEARVKTGSATERGYLGSGISHFVEHMLFKGTKRWPNPGDIEKQVKALGGYANGFTSYDSTGFYIVLPSEHTDDALEIMKGILTESLFNPEEFQKEREVILKEIRLNRDEPSRYLSQLLWANMFKVHNYHLPVIGYEDVFKSLKIEDLLDYYKTYYTPDNIVLGIVGDIDAQKVSEKTQGLFEGIQRPFANQACSQQEPPQITSLTIEEQRELALAYISMGFHGVSIQDNDMFGLDVLAIILGGGTDSRLFKRLYRKQSLVYAIGSSDYTPKDPGAFVINVVLKKENIDKALAEILGEIEDLKTRTISDAELEKAKKQVLSAYIFSKQAIQEQAGDLVSGEIITGDYDFSKKYVEGINAVTKDKVLEAARRYLRKENMTLIKLIPQEKKAPSEAAATAGRERTAASAPDIEKVVLANKLRILLLQDNSLPVTSFAAVGLGGVRTETFKNNGISNLVSETLLCGTKDRSEDAISSQVEGMGAGLSTFSGSNSFGLSGNCLSKDINPLLDISADVLQNPVFNEEKIEREKSAAYAAVNSAEEDIYRSGIKTLKYLLFRDHPYRFQAGGRISTIEGFTQKEILGYYHAYYRPDNMVLVIAGDINKDKAKEKITTLFQKFRNGPGAVTIKPAQEKKRSKPRIISRNMDKEQSLVLLGYLGATLDSHDKYVLDVLSSVLSGINGRLAQRIREAKGLAYALDMRSIAGIERGMIIFYIGTTKENLDVAKTELFKEIALLQKEGITAEELKNAKSELAGLNRIGLQRIQDVGMRAALDELYGFGYSDFTKYEDRVRHITRECVARAAKKYLGPDSYVLLMIKGNKQR